MVGRILVVDDEPEIRALLGECLVVAGFDTMEAADGAEAVAAVQAERPAVILLDVTMPRQGGMEALPELKRIAPDVPVIMCTAHMDVPTAVRAMQLGAYDYLTKPFDPELLVLTVKRAFERQALLARIDELKSQGEGISLADRMGSSGAIESVIQQVAQVARSSFTVLVQGETGTGKELVARAIHYASPRAERPFVAIDSAALPENLFESELFGHERGAFTGAVQSRRGLLETADGSTCFLDEIGELSLGLQAKLLRVLQERVLRRVGGNEPISVNLRLIAATNRDLRKRVEEGTFREDLYYRLNGVTIAMPPLRERGADIPLLAHDFMQRYAEAAGKPLEGFTPEALALLSGYRWPGNVRELEHAIERAVALARSAVILPEDLPPEIRAETARAPALPAPRMTLDEVKRWYVATVLEETAGNKVRAADLLGIDRRTLYRILERQDDNE